ncbi:hypothetical protein ACHAXS_006903 [Conticribra weissflogii]
MQFLRREPFTELLLVLVYICCPQTCAFNTGVLQHPPPSSHLIDNDSVGIHELPIATATINRRALFHQTIASAVAASTAATSSLLSPAAASAAEKPPPIVPLVTTAQRLRRVPVFAIVDGNGTPFHTYDKDSAGGFGYFFTSYTSATYVLDDAKKAFEKAKNEQASKVKSTSSGEGGTIGEDGQDDVPDAWGQARIVTLPLDVVMQLSVKKTQSVAQNGKGKKFDTYYQVIPSTEDLNAALRIENGPRYSERGRVPLFYIDGLTIPSPSNEPDGATITMNPVYFRIKDLVSEYQKQNPNATYEEITPKIKVRELNETFRAMIRPGGKDESVRNMVFVPIPESVEKAKECSRNYKLGEMILTK